jgi:hypothetical protein
LFDLRQTTLIRVAQDEGVPLTIWVQASIARLSLCGLAMSEHIITFASWTENRFDYHWDQGPQIFWRLSPNSTDLQHDHILDQVKQELESIQEKVMAITAVVSNANEVDRIVNALLTGSVAKPMTEGLSTEEIELW